MKHTLLTPTALLLAPLAALHASGAKPDIVFIIADDLGWADVAFHGGNAPTPNLDRLKREGVELAKHYVAPVCSPTRTGLMTGRFWSRFGVTTPVNERALPWDTVTLQHDIQREGGIEPERIECERGSGQVRISHSLLRGLGGT